MIAADQIPSEFDWVTARHGWSRTAAFEALRTVVSNDVEKMQACTDDVISLTTSQLPYMFSVHRSRNIGGFIDGLGTVRFHRSEKQITITREDGRGDALPGEIILTPTMMPNGALKLAATGTIEGTFELWQISRAALEPLFFPA